MRWQTIGSCTPMQNTWSPLMASGGAIGFADTYRLRFSSTLWDPVWAVGYGIVRRKFSAGTPKLIDVKDASQNAMFKAAVCSYVGCLGTGAYEEQPFNGVFHRNSKIRLDDIVDGVSKTIGIGERMSRHTQSSWVGVTPGQTLFYAPESPRFDPANPSSNNRPAITATLVHVRSSVPSLQGSPGGFIGPHTAGTQFLNMDGSCRLIDASTSPEVFRALCTRNGNEVVTAE
jgi:hypothetical protein